MLTFTEQALAEFAGEITQAFLETMDDISLSWDDLEQAFRDRAGAIIALHAKEQALPSGFRCISCSHVFELSRQGRFEFARGEFVQCPNCFGDQIETELSEPSGYIWQAETNSKLMITQKDMVILNLKHGEMVSRAWFETRFEENKITLTQKKGIFILRARGV
jgi:hypothetical protein